VLWGASVTTSDIDLSFSNGYSLKLVSEDEEGYSVFHSTGSGDNRTYGTTKYYQFKAGVKELSGASSFQVSVANVEASTFPLSHGAFIVPSLTQYDNQTAYITIAVPSEEVASSIGEFSVTVSAPVPQPLTLAPVIQTGKATWQPDSTVRGGFMLRTALFEVGQKVTGAVGVKLISGTKVVDTLVLPAGVAGW